MSNNTKKLFVVEDDDSIREMLIYALSSAGFNVSGFVDGGSLFEKMQKDIPSLILLDIMLPGDDGLTILKKIRTEGKNKAIPIIMLTAKGTEIDRVKGLDLGADDYITKPFSVMEVISRVNAVLRRCIDSKKDEIIIDGVALFYNKRVVLVDDQEVVLTYKEFELLYYLMLNEGIVLSRDNLLSEIWGFDYDGESRTVDMHIKSLRHKLNTRGDIIKTVRNVGYKIGG